MTNWVSYYETKKITSTKLKASLNKYVAASMTNFGVTCWVWKLPGLSWVEVFRIPWCPPSPIWQFPRVRRVPVTNIVQDKLCRKYSRSCIIKATPEFQLSLRHHRGRKIIKRRGRGRRPAGRQKLRRYLVYFHGGRFCLPKCHVCGMCWSLLAADGVCKVQ